MAEKLTADGHLWRDGTGRPYVWLPRAQALADALEACKAERDALRDEARKRAETAEQREARLRAAISRYRRWFDTVTKTQIPDYEERAADALDELDAALVDLPATPAAEPQPTKPREHRLKTWPEFFVALLSGAKTFEIRTNERDFRVGDVLILVEYDPETAQFSGRELRRVITYITDWEQVHGHVVMAIAAEPQPRPPKQHELYPADYTYRTPPEMAHLKAVLADEEPDPAPTALDPALREPLPRGREIVSGACNRMKNSDLLASSKPVTVAIDQVVDEASDRIEKLWRRIDGEPQRTRQAVAAEVRRWAPTSTFRFAMERRADQLAPPPQQGGTEGREK